MKVKINRSAPREPERKILTIDPGSREAGCCFWLSEDWHASRVAGPIKSTVAKTKKHSLVDRCHDLVDQLEIDWLVLESIYVEKPKVFGTSLGFAAKDSAMELMFFVGWLSGLADEYHHDVHLVEIHEWKGTLPKTLINKRISDVACKNKIDLSMLSKNNSHDWDACGIGFHSQGASL
jgi:hypothetical protein